ncbi:hypothetical protein GE061_018052 [Apolygus lucorum]|uniref:Uncharacterized protein n=1 Tax=Apolygus lucorum TaxID=248454 RepID=A0A8S9XFG0_APOLU|nr:hypothetical protein GE061_018052 [Apolygus lucorum]
MVVSTWFLSVLCLSTILSIISARSSTHQLLLTTALSRLSSSLSNRVTPYCCPVLSKTALSRLSSSLSNRVTPYCCPVLSKTVLSRLSSSRSNGVTPYCCTILSKVPSHRPFLCPHANYKSAAMTDSTSVHYNISLNLLRRWDIFSKMEEDDMAGIKAFHSFETPSYRGCVGGKGIFVITSHDEVYGMGHNCAFINILGFHKADPDYREEDVSTMCKITTLSNKKIQQISIGGLIGAALSSSGTLYWWGNCYNRGNGDLMTPHIPRTGRRRYLRVSCGHRLMSALTLSGSVYVWGQVVNNETKFLEGERIIVGSSITDISCGLHHLAILDVDGFVYTWGRGDEGQRGLANYNHSDQYRLTKITEEPCMSVKCGPYSTFCISGFHELLACGSNRNLHLGIYKPHPVCTLTRIYLDGAVTDVTVVGLSDHTVLMSAHTSDGDFYTWGSPHEPYPELAEAGSFMEVFTGWNLTPALTHIRSGQPTNLSLRNRPEESDVMSDVLVYIYLRDRPDMYNEATKFLWRSKSRNLPYLATRLTSEESGRTFVLQKFLQDVSTKHQCHPEAEDDECCGWQYLGGYSFYV